MVDALTVEPQPGTDDRALISAVLELVSELRLAEVLRRIVRTASILVDARRGAVAVLDVQDQVVELVEPGLQGDQGSLAFLVSEGLPIGLLTSASPTQGEPAAFALGVPIRSRRGFRANIYTADKRDGAGFTSSDEALLVSFAAVAGAVIDNAQLYEEGQQRELWVALQSQIATALLAGVDIDQVLDLVARGARELTDADASTVLLYDGSSSMSLRAADGRVVHQLVGRMFPLDRTISGDVIETGEAVLLQHGSSSEATDEPLLCVEGMGRAIFVPLVADGGTTGTLAVGRLAGRTPLAQTDFWLLESFASQVSVALEYGRARTELQRLAVVEDQERIARDLHDTVIQQIFATGMSLQATAHRMSDAAAAERVQQAVDMLDRIIRDIRSAVFALGSPVRNNGGMRATISALASQMFEPSGVTPRLHFDGPVDTAIRPDAEEHVVATLREALSNVIRHARASRVDVFVHVGSEIVLRVADDGVGVGDHGAPRSGLLNLRARAEALGGEMLLTAPPTGGTTLEWRVPLAGPRPADRPPGYRPAG